MQIEKSAVKLVVFLLALQSPHHQDRLTLPERISLARPLLLHAETAAASIDPADRAFLLYRTAGGWLDLDVAHAVELDRQAFAAARLIHSDTLREYAEHDVLADLLPLSPSAELELITHAEPKVQKQMYKAAILFSLIQRDVTQATKAFDHASAAGVFLERATVPLLAATSRNNTVERVRIFESAMAAYKMQTPENSRPWSASAVLARYWRVLPSGPVLAAIDILLARAAEKDQKQPVGSASMSSYENTLSYNSYSDLELFAVAPALLKLDSARAAKLLAIHPAVQEYLSRFHDGLPSFDKTFFYAMNENLGVTPPIPPGRNSFATEQGAHSSTLSALDEGIEFTIPLNLAQGLGVTGSTIYFASAGSPEAGLLGTGNTCPPDVPHILASVDTVPLSRRIPMACSGPNGDNCTYADQFPRLDVLDNIAERCTYYLNRPAALATLATQLQTLRQIPEYSRPDYLANAADLYLRLEDRNGAAEVVRTGFKVAASLFSHDSQSAELQSLPKAVWPSAEVYRRMISVGSEC
jgi:hypothetical protein